MASLETIKSAVTTAARGYKDGVSAGNKVVNVARTIDNVMSSRAPTGIPRADAAIRGYHGAQQADRLRQQFARTNPRDAPGPRTAAFYQYRYRAPGRHSFSGTPHQHEMLERLRRQHEQIRQAATQPRMGNYRDNTPPTVVSRDEHIRRFASTPEIAEQAIFRADHPKPNRPPRRTPIERSRPSAPKPGWRPSAAPLPSVREDMPQAGLPRSFGPRR